LSAPPSFPYVREAVNIHNEHSFHSVTSETAAVEHLSDESRFIKLHEGGVSASNHAREKVEHHNTELRTLGCDESRNEVGAARASEGSTEENEEVV